MKTGRSLVDELKTRVNRNDVVAYLSTAHRGHAERVKVRDLTVRFLGVSAFHADEPPVVAVAEIVRELVLSGSPIGSVPGGHGGIYWIATEQERASALRYLESIRDSLDTRIDALRAAEL